MINVILFLWQVCTVLWRRRRAFEICDCVRRRFSVLIAETEEELQKTCHTWKRSLQVKEMKVNLVKTKIIVSKIGHISTNPSSKKDKCGICGRKTMTKAELYKSCEKWIHGRCAKNKRATNRLGIDLRSRKCKGNHKNVVDKEEKLHEDVETMTGFTYLGNRINSQG